MCKIFIIFITLSLVLIGPIVFSKEETLSKEVILEIVKKLGDDNFAIREKATKDLIKISIKYSKILNEELLNTNDLEIKERLQFVLDQTEEKLNDLFSESIMRGYHFLGDKQYDDALKEVDGILDIKPNYYLATLLKIKIYENKGDNKNCIQTIKPYLETLKKDSNDYEDLSLKLGNLLLYNGNYDEAVKQLETMEAFARFPDKVSKLLADAYELNNQNQKSEERLLKELLDKPNDAYTKSKIAWFYIRIGNKEKGLTFLKDMEAFPIENGILDVLNCMFLDDKQSAIKKIKTITAPLLKKYNGAQNISLSEISPMDILYLCYQHYFQKILKSEETIDFKILYNAYSKEEKNTWPVPLLGLFSGELSKEKMEELLQSTNLWEMRKNLCEAWFYLGLLKMTENNTKEAKKYFQLCKDQKVYDYIETTASCYFLQTIK
jgi:Tfp pilus assembly protein PilF